jgi:hypothetical protein
MKTAKIESNQGKVFDFFMSAWVNVILIIKAPKEDDKAKEIVNKAVEQFAKLFIRGKLGRASYLIPKQACECGYIADQTTGVGNNHMPRSGDLALCANCGKLTAYQVDLTKRELTDDELKYIQASPGWHQILKTQLAIKQNRDVHSN